MKWEIKEVSNKVESLKKNPVIFCKCLPSEEHGQINACWHRSSYFEWQLYVNMHLFECNVLDKMSHNISSSFFFNVLRSDSDS